MQILACLTSSLRRSAVRAGMEMRITLPSFDGLSPRSATSIAFSISVISDLSNGDITTVRAYGIEIVATWLSGDLFP